MEDSPKGGIQRLVGIAVLCSARKYRDVVGVCLFVLAEFGETRLTALKLSAAGTIAGYLPAGQYRFNIVTATAVYCSAAAVPLS